MRKVIEVIPATPASDGDGVKLLRVFGGPGPERFDPFLMLDEFGSNKASDYIGGFPSHPHRGFETVTYMLEGKMEHRDHLDNVGLLSDGDVQWMTAARGIIHSEMPKQTEGRMRGFQFWLNLAASKKMQPPSYDDVKAKDIPVVEVGHIWLKALAGSGAINNVEVKGYFERTDTRPLIWDVHIPAQGEARVTLPADLEGMIYVYEGSVNVGGETVNAQNLARLAGAGDVDLTTTLEQGLARLLIIAGKPLNEPIAQYGPFVMNTNAEIEQAIKDYQSGALV